MSEAHVESQTASAHDHHDTVAEDDRTNLRAIVIWFIGIVVAVIIAVIYVQNYFGIEMRRELSEKVLTADNPVLRDLRATEHAKLTKYQWVDQKAGILRIPLDRAEELTLRDWSSRAQAATSDTAEAAPAEGSPSETADPKPAEGSEGVK